MSKSHCPVLYFIAGPNGCGKSTFIHSLRAAESYDLPYVCPDEEARNLFEISDKTLKDKTAWEISRSKREKFIDEKISFITETVFSHESHIDFLKKAKSQGYFIISYYVIVENADICINRVKKRVDEGGHSVDINKIVSRYDRSVALLPKLVEISDACAVYDNTVRYELLLYKQNNTIISNISKKDKEWFYSKVISVIEKDGYSIIF